MVKILKATINKLYAGTNKMFLNDSGFICIEYEPESITKQRVCSMFTQEIEKYNLTDSLGVHAENFCEIYGIKIKKIPSTNALCDVTICFYTHDDVEEDINIPINNLSCYEFAHNEFVFAHITRI